MPIGVEAAKTSAEAMGRGAKGCPYRTDPADSGTVHEIQRQTDDGAQTMEAVG